MIKIGKYCIIILLLLFTQTILSTNEQPGSVLECTPLSERDALVDLYDSTLGKYWRINTNWNNPEVDYCQWYGVNCGASIVGNQTFTYVASIILSLNNLTGTLPPSIGSFFHLQILDLQQNMLLGSIPPTLGCLRRLEALLLSDNLIYGVIPETVGLLESLQHLVLHSNRISGSIPDQIIYLQNLTSLSLENNALSGSIPQNINNMQSLRNFVIDMNQITGTIPSTIVQMKGLLGISLRFNRISGTIPPLTSDSSLTALYLEFNNISGTIPESIFEIENLKVFEASGNLLAGTLPSSFSSIRNLTVLNLSQNQLEGSIPPFSSSTLKFIDLSTNEFTGHLPDMSGAPNVILVDLSGNYIGGELPETPPPFLRLKMMDLSSNSLTGMVPNWMSEVKTATVFLSYNEFMCPYPSLPLNINIQTECYDNKLYQGLCLTAVLLFEFVGCTATIVGVVVVVTRMIRPSALSFLSVKDFELSYLQRRDEIRFKYVLSLRALCALEMLSSLMMVMLGFGLRFSSSMRNTYSPLFLISIPIIAMIFLIKSIIVMIGSFQKYTHPFIISLSTQILQLIFVWWSIQITIGIGQSNTIIFLYFLIIFFDTFANVIAMVNVYYIQNQFIPYHQLEFIKPLGEGMFGDVWHAKYSGKDVAIKRAKVAKKYRKIMYAVYLHEAQLMSKVCHHPNIVTLVGMSSNNEEEIYIATEYCEGGNALDYLTVYRSSHNYEEYFRVIIKICMGVCDAMHYLHSNGFTHRDITISNIMIKRGKGILGDFGLAKHESEEEKIEKTGENQLLTPLIHELYSPPEVTEQGGVVYNKTSDIYQFGILMWEMLMLRKWTKVDKLNGPSYCLMMLIPSVPHAFVKIIARCWNEEPDLRPKFWELLEDFSKLNQFESSTYRNVGEAVGFPMGIINM